MDASHELSIEALERIDKACCEFEKDLKKGKRKKLGAYLLEEGGHERSALLQELIGIDIDYRRKRGEPVLLADYEAEFPGDAIAVKKVFLDSNLDTHTHRATATQLEQIIAEYVSDEASGMTREDLLNQHPELADDLRDFFHHRDRMDNLVNPLKTAASPQLNVRCPHC
ncbi:hypothetical protein ACFL2H_05225, partial [Planctomycetota bacterium]